MTKVNKICGNCGKQFQADSREHNRGNAKYCSLSCVAIARIYKKNIKRNCVYCRNSFLAGSVEAKYCSKSCKAKNYRKQQITNEYHTKTLQRILKHLSCEICGWNEAPRDLHHIIPVSDGGKNKLNNVIIVCPNHHRMFHNNLVSEEAVLTALKSRLSLHPELYQEQDALAGD